jgi:hypothetical protein
MFWFADVENRLATGAVTSAALLRNADSNWGTLEDSDFLMEERRNGGGWIRPWYRALTEFQSKPLSGWKNLQNAATYQGPTR